MKKKFIQLFILLIIFALTACRTTIEQGPQGEPGIQGEVGPQGQTGNGISSIEKTNSEGLIDTYTITFTNGNTTTFTVTNGKDGVQGIQGVKGEDGHTPIITIQDGYWYIDGENTNIKATQNEPEYVYASLYGIYPGYVDINKFNEMINDEKIKNKSIYFSDGEYIFSSTLNMVSNVSIYGGANTIFKLDKKSDVDVLLSLVGVDNVKIYNLKIEGTNTARPVEKAKKIGIKIESCRSVNLENIDIIGWGLYGLYSKTMSSYGAADEGKFFKQLQIVNVRFYYNYIGSYLDYRCEYTQMLNCVFGENYIGSINCGGNNMYVSCMWNSNSYGFILNNDGSNPAHGGCNSSTFNHNDNAIQVNDCVNGWTFDACQIFYGKIELINSKGVIFNSNIWGSCKFYSSFPGKVNQNLITNTYFLTDSSSILANNDGSTLVYCCLPDHLPEDVETDTRQNIIDDEEWIQLMYTANGIHPGASNCYFSNCTSPVEANKLISNLYISIYGASYNSVVPGVNIWIVNAKTNTVVEKIIDNQSLDVYYSKKLKEYVLNIEINKSFDYPIYFVAQAVRENGVGISYSYGSQNSQFLDTTKVTIGQIISPNSNIVAEFSVYCSG